MRISDWSSDVCSSDLGAARAGQGVQGPVRKQEPRHRLCLDPRQCDPEFLAMTRKLLALFVFMAVSLAFGAQMGRASDEEKPIKVDYRFTPPAQREPSEAEMMATSEIGRASWRERVGQEG